MAASTVQAILPSEGLGRLDTGDRASAPEPIKRYQRDKPGELVHVDVKKLAGIPPGGGWKTHGRGNTPDHRRTKAGYRYIHTAIDDRTRLAYSEILNDEQGATAAAFWRRAHQWFTDHAITVERCLTDNGACYLVRPLPFWVRALPAADLAALLADFDASVLAAFVAAADLVVFELPF